MGLIHEFGRGFLDLDKVYKVDIFEVYTDPVDLVDDANGYFEHVYKSRACFVETSKSGVSAGQSFETEVDKPLTLQGLCAYLAITKRDFNKLKSHEDFERACELIEDKIAEDQLTGAILNAYNAGIVTRLQGLSEKRELEADVTMQKPLSKEEVAEARSIISEILEDEF